MYKTKVSIVMPSYNKGKFIEKAIESVVSQSFKDWELIIVDDASTDNSVELIRQKMNKDNRIVLWQNNKNMGIAATRNRAIGLAKGKYIALLDADDISPSERLEKEVNFLEKHEDIDVVFGGFLEIDENDNIKQTYFTPLKNPQYIKANLMVCNVIPNGTGMYRKNFVQQFNLEYKDGYLGMEDYLFWIECSLHGRISSIPEVCLYWRNTTENGTNTYLKNEKYKSKREEKYAEILNYALEGNGFCLTERERQVYCKVLAEGKYKIETLDCIEDFFEIIKKICYQAEEKDNVEEIRKVMKRQFGRSLENAYIWDN